jgi:hypothetical protein
VATDPERSSVDAVYFEVDGDYSKIGDMNDLVEYLKNDQCEFNEDVQEFIDIRLEEWCEEEFDWEDSDIIDDLIEYINRDSIQIDKIYLENRQEIVQTFLSKKEAEKHLEANYYHYHKDAFIDRRKPWRNQEMSTLVKLLYRIGEQVTK